MLHKAKRIGTSRKVEWRQADAMRLPFSDATFDAVVCQFGVMFFSDKPQGVFRSASSAQAGRHSDLQRLGPHLGERIRRHRYEGARMRISRRSAALPVPHPARLLRRPHHPARSCRGRVPRLTTDRHGSTRAVGRIAPVSRPSPIVREHRYGTRSKPGTLCGLVQPRPGSGGDREPVRSGTRQRQAPRPMSSPSSAEAEEGRRRTNNDINADPRLPAAGWLVLHVCFRLRRSSAGHALIQGMHLLNAQSRRPFATVGVEKSQELRG